MARSLNVSCTIQVPRNMLFADLRLTPAVLEKMDDQAMTVFAGWARKHGEDPAALEFTITGRTLDKEKNQQQLVDPSTAQHVPFHVAATVRRRLRIL
jgi:predicted hotdog family 3-hydroxylacyl-ACP dehydratase